MVRIDGDPVIHWLTADVFDGLATLDDGSVDLVVTSPPFLALRSYLPADHPDKSKEIGSEATPAEFIDTLLAVTAELRRVLAPHGSICVELGDTYAGAAVANNREYGESEMPFDPTRHDRPMSRRFSGYEGEKSGTGWPLAKSRALIPQLYEIALAYGINPLTGQPSPAGQWRIRNVVTWARPNPPVGALGDKWRPATSDVVVACVSDKRYWDDLATRRHTGKTPNPRDIRHSGIKGDPNGGRDTLGPYAGNENPAGAPLLDYWEIPPGGYKGSHYAVFPEELVVPCVKAMCPEKVCRTCGEPSRRIVEKGELRPSDKGWTTPIDRWDPELAKKADHDHEGNRWQHLVRDGFVPGHVRDQTTLGWTDCGHDDYRPGLVLDPFAGSGTTLAVATGHGHDAIGIDLDPRNEDLARERVGPLMFEVSP